MADKAVERMRSFAFLPQSWQNTSLYSGSLNTAHIAYGFELFLRHWLY